MDNVIKKSKVTFFSAQTTFNLTGDIKAVDYPIVMGIINTTPDSFYATSRATAEKAIVTKVNGMVEGGAIVIDIGGVSSRPGASDVDEAEEEKRVLPWVKTLSLAFPDIIISVDTGRASIARKCVDAGARMINDIYAGTLDKDMAKTIAELKIPYIMMHMKGLPGTMQDKPDYDYNNIITQIGRFFSERLKYFQSHGVHDIILDPGFGFGKTSLHNFELIGKLSYFRVFERPILIGLSRKSTIYNLLGGGPEDALNGSSILHTMALLNGASILRVHDVKEAVEATKLVNTFVKAHV